MASQVCLGKAWRLLLFKHFDWHHCHSPLQTLDCVFTLNGAVLNYFSQVTCRLKEFAFLAELVSKKQFNNDFGLQVDGIVQ